MANRKSGCCCCSLLFYGSTVVVLESIAKKRLEGGQKRETSTTFACNKRDLNAPSNLELPSVKNFHSRSFDRESIECEQPNESIDINRAI